MYARESFTIAEVADLLSIRRLSDSYQDEFPVECPFCGDLRGKCSFCIRKNGELKNVYHCYHCGAAGNMLTLYAELSGIYGRNRYKEAYREIRQALSFSGTDERQQSTTRNGFASIVPKKKRISLTEEEWDYRDHVYKEMLTFLTNDKEEKVNFSHTFTNKRVNATIDLVKEDSETGNSAQGDAVFEGAIYGLYAREDINHPDGRSGVLYKKDEQVATLTTDKEGKASVSNLYLGKYYLKEITPPVGYLLDEEEHDVNCDYEGDQVETVKRNTVSKEDVIKQPFQLIKAADNDKTDADLLKGAGFSAYLISSLTVKDDGSYDFTNATPIVLTEDGKTEMFTDERGYACSIPIPYGRYIVRETTTPHNFMPIDDFIVTVTENSSTPQVWRVLLDDEFKAKLKIVKQDDETKQPVLLANTEFKVYDLDAKKYVEQVTTYPNTVVHKSYFTDENGYLILPESLKCGNYRIEEVSAPDGYTQNTQYVEIKVDKNTAYQMDSVSGDAIITVTYENHPVKGKLVIHKSGETLKSFKKDFVYEETSLEGAEFEIYAAEDIFTPDHQVDEQGNRHMIYAKDTLVKTVTTTETPDA